MPATPLSQLSRPIEQCFQFLTDDVVCELSVHPCAQPAWHHQLCTGAHCGQRGLSPADTCDHPTAEDGQHCWDCGHIHHGMCCVGCGLLYSKLSWSLTPLARIILATQYPPSLFLYFKPLKSIHAVLHKLECRESCYANGVWVGPVAEWHYFISN